MKWYNRITDNKDVPIREYKGHKAFLYYKWTTRLKNISLNLAWLRYNAALCAFRNDRIIKFAILRDDEELKKLIVKKGNKQIIIDGEVQDDQ